MKAQLVQLQQRIEELEKLADKLAELASEASRQKNVQPQLSVTGQRWYRGARELLKQHGFSGLKDFDHCYEAHVLKAGKEIGRHHTDIEQFIDRPSATTEQYQLFTKHFQKARALLRSCLDEIESRELPVRTQLSFGLAADEFDKAQQLLDESKGDDALIRAAGVVARVALERHLLTVADTRSIPIQVNPPSKKQPNVSDVLSALVKASVITAVQRSELDSLFSVANHCAHPKEVIVEADVRRLVSRGKELAAVII